VTAHDTTTTAAASGIVPGPREGSGPALDQERLDALLGQVVGDLGALLTAPLVLLGDRLGLFTALADGESTTADELADRTGTSARYVAEWLLAMAASGYVDHRGDGRFGLSPEQAAVFTQPDHPAHMAGGFQSMNAAVRNLDRMTEAFRTGEGVGWHEHHDDMFEGTERFFRPGYLASLTSSWIPSLDGLEERLHGGAQVADVGCGLGASTRIMAAEYPASFFVGTDYHGPSIAQARERAEQAGVSDRIRFDVVSAQELSGHYDLVTMFDCLHDMPDPLAALQSVRRAVRDDGWVLMVEPMSWDSVEEALNPVGRVYAGASVLICLPSGLSAEPRTGLGNQAGPARTLALAEQAGFSRAREATRTPFNIVYELRA
jgi:2-polyprenyl-3-methyl-5-hydroxy-6-metoxy-1,4-benzoquinol methylase